MHLLLHVYLYNCISWRIPSACVCISFALRLMGHRQRTASSLRSFNVPPPRGRSPSWLSRSQTPSKEAACSINTLEKQGFARHISFASLLLCVRPPRNSLGAVAPSPCSCNSIAFAMTTEYRVNYLDYCVNDENVYDWSYQSFNTLEAAQDYLLGCEPYEQASLEIIEREKLEQIF